MGWAVSVRALAEDLTEEWRSAWEVGLLQAWRRQLRLSLPVWAVAVAAAAAAAIQTGSPLHPVLLALLGPGSRLGVLPGREDKEAAGREVRLPGAASLGSCDCAAGP